MATTPRRVSVHKDACQTPKCRGCSLSVPNVSKLRSRSTKYVIPVLTEMVERHQDFGVDEAIEDVRTCLYRVLGVTARRNCFIASVEFNNTVCCNAQTCIFPAPSSRACALWEKIRLTNTPTCICAGIL